MATATESIYLQLLGYAGHLLVILAGLGVAETLRRLVRMEKKQDEQRAIHEQCRLTLMSKEDFNKWKETDLKEWKKGRDGPGGLWESINHHSHKGIEGLGEVIKK